MQTYRIEFLTDRQVAQFLSVARPTVWRWVHEGRLPKPVKIGPACTRWRLDDIEEFARRCSEESAV